VTQALATELNRAVDASANPSPALGIRPRRDRLGRGGATFPRWRSLELVSILAKHEVEFIVVSGMVAVLRGTPVSTFGLDVVYERERSELCGCFHCLAVFPPSLVSEWIDEVDDVGTTAMCPRCGIDSVTRTHARAALGSTLLRSPSPRMPHAYMAKDSRFRGTSSSSHDPPTMKSLSQ
jgi:hypothetical protein